MDISIVSYILGIISIFFYSIIYFPQILLIYRTKNSDNLSLLMFILWSQADSLSLIGVILLNFELNLIVIGWYHVIIGIIMMIVILFYKKQDKIINTAYVFAFSVINISLCIVLQSVINEPELFIGETIGWITTSLYIIGRFPQILLNFHKKSSDGVSIMMYVWTILGNTFYISSIITFSTESGYIKTILPWIVLACVTIFLDFLLIFQCKYYSKRTPSNIINEF